MKNYFLLISLAALLTACGGNGSTGTQNNQNGDAVAVSVKEMQPTTFRQYLTVLGTVESDKTIMISPKVSATVEDVRVRAGERVEQGEILATLDGEITRSQIQEVKTQLDLARDVFQRRENLREKNIGSEVEFLQAKNRVESLESQLATLRQQYENYNIRTSIAGRVSQVNIKQGETVSPGVPVFQVANAEALKVLSQVSESYLSSVDETDSVEVRFPSINDTLKTRLDVVSEVIDPGNRTFDVEVFIPNSAGTKIRPNMLAKLKINNITQDSVLVASINNIQQTEGEKFVYVANQTDSVWVAQRQVVQTGESYGEEIVITEGLQAGERLITVGDTNVEDGERIEITNN